MNFVDELIKNAQQRGEFDNLPGSGKPIKLDDALFGKDTQMAYKLLKDNGHTLGFIQERRQLVEKIEALRVQLKRAAERQDDSIGGRLAWRRTTNSFRLRVQKLNEAIRTYNLKAPQAQFHLMTIDAEQEIENVSS